MAALFRRKGLMVGLLACVWMEDINHRHTLIRERSSRMAMYQV